MRPARVAASAALFALLALTSSAAALSPDLTPTDLSAPTPVVTHQTVTVSWTVENQGTGSASGSGDGSWADHIYLSTDTTLDGGDTSVGGVIHFPGGLAPADSYSTGVSIVVPNVAAGSYYLLVFADASLLVSESDETNNVLAFPITIQAPDLVPTDLSVPSTLETGQSVMVSWTVTNQGDGAASGSGDGSWSDNVYLSTDTVLNGGDTNVGGVIHFPGGLVPSDNYTTGRSITVPNVPAGDYYLLIFADASTLVFESNEGNNVLAVPVTIHQCGDGIVSGGEQCDLAGANGSTTSCCTSSCQFRGAGQTCRPAVDGCDVDEQCSGTSDACPTDGFQPPSTPCPDDGNVCTSDVCNGSGACTHSAGNAGTICRPSVGPCDVTDHCDGTSPNCPADQVAGAGLECRAAAGDCDMAEVCDGVSNACPADGFKSSAVVCRGAANACDIAEHCTGTTTTCPANGFVPDGTGCDDGNACTPTDTCVSGTCVGSGGPTCDPCEICDPGFGCVLPTHPGCQPALAGKASVQLKAVAGDPSRNALAWKWVSSGTVSPADFGMPNNGSAYTLCLIDSRGGHPTLLMSTTAPDGGVCGTSACWKTNASGASYKDKLLTPQGLASLGLKAGGPRKASLKAKGKGALLPLPALGLTPPVTVRLKRSDAAACWEATYSTPGANTTTLFKAKGD